MEAHRGRLARRLGGFATLVLGCVPLLCGASFRTGNFIVEAPTQKIARTVAEHAETERANIAFAWLGKELPAWTTPCPIRVKVTSGEAGGLTSFGFNNGCVTDQSMVVEGRLDRILASALPHEITHTIFAAYFGGPMPRWADEGASLLSEDERDAGGMTRSPSICWPKAARYRWFACSRSRSIPET